MEKVKVDKEKNEVIVNFNPSFYKKEFTEQAMKDFNEACEVKTENNLIILKPKEDINIEILGYEFYNYVLGLMKNQ